ncbi:MAG: CBS domain-containing protein [Actinocatenispora sp.]
MTTATRVYVARLAGIVVFDPNGDQVGRVRDAVTRLRPGGMPPRVIGLVVEIGVRRRIFVPIGRVTSMDADAVLLSTGTLNLKRFEKKPGEILVLEDLLDRRVTVNEPGGDGKHGTVVDAGMEQERTGEWILHRVAVRENPTRLGRRGHLRQVDWDQLSGLMAAAGEQGTASLLAVLETMRAADLANTLQELSGRRRLEVASALDDERLADVLEELPEDDQIEILGFLDVERAADVLEAMDPDDAADVLAELPESEKERLLQRMEPSDAEPVRRLMDYEPGTAGSIMTSDPVVLLPDVTIAEALAAVRQPKLSPVLAAQVFVCRAPGATPTGRFLGMVHFQRLLREPPAGLVGGLVTGDLDPVAPETPIADVHRRMATYDLMAMPVVDQSDRLVGAVTVDDVLDHLLPPDWRDRDHA